MYAQTIDAMIERLIDRNPLAAITSNIEYYLLSQLRSLIVEKKKYQSNFQSIVYPTVCNIKIK